MCEPDKLESPVIVHLKARQKLSNVLDLQFIDPYGKKVTRGQKPVSEHMSIWLVKMTKSRISTIQMPFRVAWELCELPYTGMVPIQMRIF